MNHQMITRFYEPSKMDTSPFGTICKVSNGFDKFDIYLQISHEEESPAWTLIGSYSTMVTDQEIYQEIQKILLSRQ